MAERVAQPRPQVPHVRAQLVLAFLLWHLPLESLRAHLRAFQLLTQLVPVGGGGGLLYPVGVPCVQSVMSLGHGG